MTNVLIPSTGARAYYMHSVLHDWPDDTCMSILSNIKAAMERGYSKLLINENVIPDVEAHWETTALDMMMLSPIQMIRGVVDGMMARGFGRIVNLASRSVKSPHAELGLSNSARAGLVNFCAGLSRQTVARGVTINNVLPGIVATEAQEAHVRGLVAMTGRPYEEIWAERAAANPAKRYGTAEEIAAAVAFLCSAQAGFITGQSLLADGGQFPGSF